MAEQEELGQDDTDFSQNHEGEKVGGKKRLILIIVAAVSALAIGAGLFFSGIFSGGEEKAEEKPAAEHAAEAPAVDAQGNPLAPVFYELPEFLVNLNTTGKQVSFLKMRVSVELNRQEDVVKLESYMPRVTDGINSYLRELRASDLSGSAGTARLREELLLRLNKSVDGVKVNNVYITNILVQ
jgi:flagellar FliL protein